MTARHMLLLAPLLLVSCAGPGVEAQGPLQPQAVAGPCEVKKFFFLSLRSVPAEMTVRNTGEACRMVLVNYAVQSRVNAALVTGVASHGRAEAEVISGGFQAAVTYVPQPGFAGRDQFSITLEPNAVGVTFNVTVVPGG